MLPRHALAELIAALERQPAVGLIGPRQVGKTTLALAVGERIPSLYLDLESGTDREKLTDPERYLRRYEDRLVILDEVHRTPELFQSLRGLIDQGRRRGLRAGRFLVLGSASVDLLRQSGESLAGRIAYVHLGPLDVLDVNARDDDAISRLWLRGGFPESYLAADDGQSLAWRRDFIHTYLERDIPQFGPRVPAQTLERFWTMLAHVQGGLLNASELARSLGQSAQTVTRYVDLLADLLLVRRLMPYHGNVGKRLVKSPKIYIRDSGIVHALLGPGTYDALISHPVAGGSWEGFVIENLLTVAPQGSSASFYRTSAGAEIDLVLEIPEAGRWAVEIKRGLATRPKKGFYSACEDLKVHRRFVVYPGTERFPVREGVEAIGVHELASLLHGG